MAIPNKQVVNTAVKELVRHASNNSHPSKKSKLFPNWYAGITNDPKIRQVGHTKKAKVEELKAWLPKYARTFANARAIENMLCNKYGFSHCRLQGNTQDDTKVRPSKYVYVYYLPAHLR